jgi:hypothetical protein
LRFRAFSYQVRACSSSPRRAWIRASMSQSKSSPPFYLGRAIDVWIACIALSIWPVR